MKKIFLVVLSAIVLFSFAPKANSQSFLLGMVTGALLFGDGEQAGGGTGSVVYTLPRASERVKDPLGVRTSSTSASFSGNYNENNGVTWRELFNKSIVNEKKKYSPNDLEILQIVRVINPGNLEYATFWFSYIEKEKVVPLDQLPKR